MSVLLLSLDLKYVFDEHEDFLWCKKVPTLAKVPILDHLQVKDVINQAKQEIDLRDDQFEKAFDVGLAVLDALN